MRYKKGDLVVWANETLRPACYQSENIMLITEVKQTRNRWTPKKRNVTIYHYTYVETQRKDSYESCAYEYDTKLLEQQ